MNPSTTIKIAIIVDPIAIGHTTALELKQRNLGVIALYNKEFADHLRKNTGSKFGEMKYLAKVEEKETLKETKEMIEEIAVSHNGKIVCVLSGNESGHKLTDTLSAFMGLRTNNSEEAIAERDNKYLQQECINKAGLRSIKQVMGNSLSEDVLSFLKNEAYPLVLKPLDGAGTHAVAVCHTFDDANNHFQKILNTRQINKNDGETYDAVLCQEYIGGKEYVVDTVSMDGIHKTAMVWCYDKAPANGNDFVYFGMKPIDPTTKEAKKLIKYTYDALDAMHYKNGAAHVELKFTNDGEPCLIESNFRPQGVGGMWIPVAKALTGGYSQVDMTVDAYLDPETFLQKYPDQPTTPFKSNGYLLSLKSYNEGTIESIPGFDLIQKLPSFVMMNSGYKIGDKVIKTVDAVSIVGLVVLCHNDSSVLEHDIKTINAMETNNELFLYK